MKHIIFHQIFSAVSISLAFTSEVMFRTGRG
ncbi:MAG: hypothetical protein CENE_02061 [Candidatus Celerinatantimonas neptuna]|nr:MAG: hypothetical protein CENE_02061 [Candidatus Celerinatantimonas neptuna]